MPTETTAGDVTKRPDRVDAEVRFNLEIDRAYAIADLIAALATNGEHDVLTDGSLGSAAHALVDHIAAAREAHSEARAPRC